MSHDVWITGLGAVTAAGLDVDSLWDAARHGRSAIVPIQLPWNAHNNIKIGAQIPQDWYSALASEKESLHCDLFSLMALHAAQHAIAQARISADDLAGQRTAVIMGSSVGGALTTDLCSHQLYEKHQRRLDPFSVPKIMANAASSHMSIKYKITGPSFAISSACASSSQAIGLGMQLIRAGIIDQALVGGSESQLTPGFLKTWEMLRVLTPDACRPFSTERNGMALGEGGAVFVIESKKAAKQRGAKPIARLLGYGTTSDGNDLLKPDPEGCSQAMRAALVDASLQPSDIDYINAHGTGTVLNDVTEAKAIHMVFDRPPPVSSTKPIHGHTLAATGAIELILTIKAMEASVIPPTLNVVAPDPLCGLDIVPNKARPAALNIAMSNSFAFGGVNACLIVARP